MTFLVRVVTCIRMQKLSRLLCRARASWAVFEIETRPRPFTRRCTFALDLRTLHADCSGNKWYRFRCSSTTSASLHRMEWAEFNGAYYYRCYLRFPCSNAIRAISHRSPKPVALPCGRASNTGWWMSWHVAFMCDAQLRRFVRLERSYYKIPSALVWLYPPHTPTRTLQVHFQRVHWYI